MKSKMLATTALAVVASIAFPSAAAAQREGPAADPPGLGTSPGGSDAEPAELSVRVKGVKRGTLPALRRATAVGRIAPFVPGQKVRLRMVRGGKTVKRKTVKVRRVEGAEHGVFSLRSPQLAKPGRYRVNARKPATAAQAGARATSDRFKLRFPNLKRGQRGKDVKLLNRLLRKQGYHAPSGGRFSSGTARAVLAYAKVNRMPARQRASSALFERLARGKGRFKLRHPGAGRHVEVDRSRQVMVLAKGGKARHTFHVSTGKPSTPSDRGRFRFQRRHPGYNNVRMYYSVYYNRGEAIHGYRSVPNYPASHGCVRSPIPDARFIYNWVQLGMRIFVY